MKLAFKEVNMQMHCYSNYYENKILNKINIEN